MNLQEIFADGRTAAQIIDDLKYKTIRVPAWSKLEKEYNVKKHPIMEDADYNRPATNGEEVSHVTFGWQKLAVKRISELCFGIPVQRVYNVVGDDGSIDKGLQSASKIIEAIYEKNRINSINLSRGRQLYASCEAITIWYGQASDNALYAGEKALYKLRCKVFSPMKGDTLYPLFDDNDDLIALSVEYSVVNNKKDTETYFDTYTDTMHYRWRTDNGEPIEILREPVTIGKISGVYVNRDLPVWEDLSHLVYEAEWTLSRNGNYIRKNARPTFVISTDRELQVGNEPKGNRAARSVIRLGKGETAGYATWQHANDAIKFQADTLKREFFTQLQLPDMSMDEMKTTPMSGESRKMLFIDAQMKVGDESGIWMDNFDREFEVIRAHAKLMFPSHAADIDRLQVEHVITPYQIRDDTEKITNIANAKTAGIMSTRTAVAQLGWVDDVDAEVQQIETESTADLFEPTN